MPTSGHHAVTRMNETVYPIAEIILKSLDENNIIKARGAANIILTPKEYD